MGEHILYTSILLVLVMILICPNEIVSTIQCVRMCFWCQVMNDPCLEKLNESKIVCDTTNNFTEYLSLQQHIFHICKAVYLKLRWINTVLNIYHFWFNKNSNMFIGILFTGLELNFFSLTSSPSHVKLGLLWLQELITFLHNL